MLGDAEEDLQPMQLRRLDRLRRGEDLDNLVIGGLMPRQPDDLELVEPRKGDSLGAENRVKAIDVLLPAGARQRHDSFLRCLIALAEPSVRGRCWLHRLGALRGAPCRIYRKVFLNREFVKVSRQWNLSELDWLARVRRGDLG